ncbi:MAG: DUF1361 domain-containing protein [Chitinophagaceae bacterium]
MQKGIDSKYWIIRLYTDRTEMERILLLSCAFSIFLWFVRFVVTGSLMHGFLIWNLFLAYLPYSIARNLEKRLSAIKSRLSFLLIFICWLLFIPNTFYIITDLFHLDEGTAAPMWYDLALIFSFAWNGIILGVLSLYKMERIISRRFNYKVTFLFVYSIMLLNSIGIYIGRYLRFNSWDVITDPFQLANDVSYLCFHPIRNGMEWAMIFCFSILMTFMYLVLKKTKDAVTE